MGIGVDENIFNALQTGWSAHGLTDDDWDFYFIEGAGGWYYFHDFDDLLNIFGWEEKDGEIWTVSMNPSQDKILIGNLE